MSLWQSHSICVACWNAKNPDRVPVIVVGIGGPPATCCFCGQPTDSGIYVVRGKRSELPHCKCEEEDGR